MVITEKDWKNILGYIQRELEKQLMSGVYENGYPMKGVPQAIILAIGTGNLITLDGYLQSSGQKKERKKSVFTDEDETFQKFWESYPASGSFKYRGMSFNSSRVLRSNKSICQQLFNKIISQGVVSGEQLIKAISIQVEMMKKESWESGQNKLEYLSGIEVWLRQEKFHAMLEMEEQEDTQEESQNWG